MMLNNPAEYKNYVLKCFSRRDYREAALALIDPIHELLYQFKKRLSIEPAQSLRYHYQHMDSLPSSNREIPSLFVAGVDLSKELDGLSELFRDVDLQLEGNYRLAGDFYSQIRFDRLHFSDDEHHHSFHRLYWCARYAQAAAFGHPSAEDGLISDLTRWLSADWTEDRIFPYPYTTSERIASLAETLHWIEVGNLTVARELMSPIKQQIHKDAIHLMGNIEYQLGPHNHLLNNARALYAASRVLSDLSDARKWLEKAFDIWGEYFPKLLLEDGTFAEGSSFYHLMLCRTALEYVLACRQQKRPLHDFLFLQLQRMMCLANDMLRKDGTLPRFGNSSPDHNIRDLWGLMGAAYFHGVLPVSPANEMVTPLTIYYCGQVPRLLKPKRSNSIALYPAGGWAFLRNETTDVHLAIHGETAPVTRGHGDCGRGSYELFWKDNVVIREPGNVSYFLKRRHWYRSGQGQNITTLNGLPAGISAEYQKEFPEWYYASQDGEWIKMGDEGIRYVSRGFSRIDPGIVLTRSWCWQNHRQLILNEKITGRGKYGFRSYLHLGDGPWQREGTSFTRSIGSHCIQMQIAPPLNTRVKVTAAKYSPEYGVELPGKTIVLSGRVKLPLEWQVKWKFHS
jgi:hypothetical protein